MGERVEPELFEYGIQTENSDVRAHVSVVDRSIYVFQTKKGLEAVERVKPPVKPAYQSGVVGPTARGWMVNISDVEGVRHLRYHSWPRWGEFARELPTSRKGALAVDCVLDAMRIGRFPFWVDASEDDRENVQRKGTDILVFCRKRVQVKCDYGCGDRGTFYLQFAERNPLKRY